MKTGDFERAITAFTMALSVSPGSEFTLSGEIDKTPAKLFISSLHMLSCNKKAITAGSPSCRIRSAVPLQIR